MQYRLVPCDGLLHLTPCCNMALLQNSIFHTIKLNAQPINQGVAAH